MKTPLLFFTAGAAAGAFVMWLVSSSPAEGGDGTAGAEAGKWKDEKQKLTVRVQDLEKKLKAKEAGKPEAAEQVATAEAGKEKEKAFKLVSGLMDDGKLQETMRQQGEREVNREVDRLALRLKLTAEQKDALRKFLLDQKARERDLLSKAMRGGGKPEAADVPKTQSKEDFLTGLLSPEQQTEYAAAREEQRRTQAEEYAHRKVRKLGKDLSLTEDQKDKLFQSYAKQKLSAGDAGAKPAATAVTANGETTAAEGGVITFTTASVGGAMGGPVELDFDGSDFFGGGRDLDRSELEAVLSPEQLAVYDQRRAEEKEQSQMFFAPAGGPVEAVVRDAVKIKR